MSTDLILIGTLLNDLAAFSIALIACCLLSSIPHNIWSQLKASATIIAPVKIALAWVCISRSSQVIKGSHSAPLIIKCFILFFWLGILAKVGKPAPPIPAIPAR